VKVCHPWTLDSGIPAGMTAIWSLAGLYAIALGPGNGCNEYDGSHW